MNFDLLLHRSLFCSECFLNDNALFTMPTLRYLYDFEVVTC